ncbi:kirola-like [Actinidia eriantha]|uniref:kirola-like n=1 Tax=Actinidia eriantha TaxID=165200 RepID=UPI00258457E1|nr:kirola-like [Actinidia eriantha]
MDLSGKMVRQVEILSDGDVFHEIFRYRPHHISEMSPENVQSVNLHEGDWGTVGSVISWNYTIDGKEKTAKDIIEAIDEETKSVTFKVVEGDLMELYKTFKIVVHVDTKGENNLVTWTFHYEKLKEDVEEPNTLMDICIAVTKDIETHHLK